MKKIEKNLFKKLIERGNSENLEDIKKHRRHSLIEAFALLGLEAKTQKRLFHDNEIHNFYFEIDNSKAFTLILCAHYDIVNPASENANDNTASLVNLYMLCHEYLGLIQALPYNLSVVFTDHEEIGGLGAELLAEHIREGSMGMVKSVINLDLTGLGSHLFMENVTALIKAQIKKALPSVMEELMPFNDAVILRRHGIDAITLSIISLNAEGDPDKSIWRKCHSTEDCFQQISLYDMSIFREQYLLKILQNLNLTKLKKEEVSQF